MTPWYGTDISMHRNRLINTCIQYPLLIQPSLLAKIIPMSVEYELKNETVFRIMKSQSPNFGGEYKMWQDTERSFQRNRLVDKCMQYPRMIPSCLLPYIILMTSECELQNETLFRFIKSHSLFSGDEYNTMTCRVVDYPFLPAVSGTDDWNIFDALFNDIKKQKKFLIFMECLDEIAPINNTIKAGVKSNKRTSKIGEISDDENTDVGKDFDAYFLVLGTCFWLCFVTGVCLHVYSRKGRISS